MANVHPAGSKSGAITPDFDRPVVEVRMKGLLTVALIGVTMLQVLDSTIANVALPHMQAALGASTDSVSWVLTSYIIGTAVAIPITGWLADRIGGRTLLLLSGGGFILASMLCGIATSLPELVLFRLAQGMSGAFVIPLVQNLLYDMNPPSQQGKAVALFGQGTMVGPVIGPILGGYLTENYDWRWVFFINVPIGAIFLVMLFFLLPPNRKQVRNLDIFGFLTMILAVGCLQLFLDRGERIDWFESPETWITVAVGLSAAWMFVVRQLTTSRPLYPRNLFADRNLTVGVLLMLVLGIVMMSSMALLPPMLQKVLGYPVEYAGLLMAPRGFGTIVAMFLVGRTANRLDARIPLLLGFLVTAGTMWWMTQWTFAVSDTEIIVSGIFQGAGLGLIFVPLNLVTFATIGTRFRTDAVSLIALTRNIGQSIGITIMTVLLTRSMSESHAYLSEYTSAERLGGLTAGMIEGVGEMSQPVLAMLEGEISRQATMIAYLNDFNLMMIGCLVAMPLMLLTRKRQIQPTAHDMVVE